MASLFRARNAPVAFLYGQVDAGVRLYAVGDIHGRADLLVRMIETIAEDAATRCDERDPHLVFLGDYIDHGPRSRETVATLMMLEDALVFEGITLLRGRHEGMLLDFLADPVGNPGWLRAGGIATLTSYDVAPPGESFGVDSLHSIADALTDCLGDHLDFLKATKLTFRCGDVVCAHAAYDPTRPLDRQTEADVLWGAADAMSVAAMRGVRLVHGAVETAMPVTTAHRIGIDTGAYFSDRLSAVCLDDGERFLTAGP